MISLLVVVMGFSGSNMSLTSQVFSFRTEQEATAAAIAIGDSYRSSTRYDVKITKLGGTV